MYVPSETPRDTVVLVVDYEPVVLKLIASILTDAGVPVLLAANGAEAVAMYRLHRRQIGLVLLDVSMPVQDGPATLAELLRIDAGVRCCFVSGHSRSLSADELLARGAVGFVQKPFKVRDLISVVRSLSRPAAIDGAANNARDGITVQTELTRSLWQPRLPHDHAGGPHQGSFAPAHGVVSALDEIG
jgi:CheY-like chemotaxis protein